MKYQRCSEDNMRTYLTALLILLALAGVAQGVTTVYGPVAAMFSGESTGVSTSFVNGTAPLGDTTAVSVSAGNTLRLMRVDFQPDSDLAGTVNIQIGSTVVYAINNALGGNVYGKNLNTNFNVGGSGEDLVINSPGPIRYNADYRVD
jgi:hypothetical protein